MLETKGDGSAQDDDLGFAHDGDDVSAFRTKSIQARHVGFLFGSGSANDLVISKDDPLLGVARKEDGKLRPEPRGFCENSLADGQHTGLCVERSILLHHVPAVSHRGLTLGYASP